MLPSRQDDRTAFLVRFAPCWLWLLVVFTGCQFLSEEHRDPADVLQNHAAGHAKDSKEGPTPGAAGTAKPTSDNAKTPTENNLANDLWVLAIAKPGTAEKPPFRWRNAALETWQLQSPDPHNELRQSLRDRSRTVAANAAILLAHDGVVEATPVLLQSIQDPSHKLPQRRAAAEALGSLPPETAVKNLHSALTAIDKKVGAAQPAYNPELHAELLLALAKHRGPDDDPAFAAALTRDEPLVRKTALAEWSRPGVKPLPDQVADLCENPDPRVRVATIQAIAARPSDAALDQLHRATRDQNLDVRLAAIAGLGKLKSEASQKVLEQILAHEGELLRAAAVRSLAAQGNEDVFATAAKDKSHHVRVAAAEGLSRAEPGRFSELARRFVADNSGDVQQATIAAIAEWPLSAAGPLWLIALEESGYPSRKKAARQLADRWPPAKDYSPDAPAERRAARLKDLREKWNSEFGTTLQAIAPKSSSPTGRIPADHEKSSEQSTLSLAVDRLRSPDVEERRQAVREISQAAARRPLAAGLLSQVVERMIVEQDATVWQTILSAVESDERPDGVRLACAGLSHPSGEVRRRSCEHLAVHGKPANAAALVATLNDEQPGVQMAAARALGQIGGPESAPALERLLSARDKSVRVAAAESLLKLGVPSGGAALERLTFDVEEKIRRQAVEAMGRSTKTEFTPSLIRLLDDRAGVRGAALEALNRTVGKNVLPPEFEHASADKAPELARAYKRWHAEHSTP